MNISLTPELENFIVRRVETGMYHSASEVVRDALRLLKQRDELYKIQLAELKKDIAVGVEQSKQGKGRPMDFDDFKIRARKRFEERKRRD
jgi:antitoxin ParD1/3/4